MENFGLCFRSDRSREKISNNFCGGRFWQVFFVPTANKFSIRIALPKYHVLLNIRELSHDSLGVDLLARYRNKRT